MSLQPDLEGLRRLALYESTRQAEKEKEKEEFLAGEARRLAKEHLPGWAEKLEWIIQRHHSFCCHVFHSKIKLQINLIHLYV